MIEYTAIRYDGLLHVEARLKNTPLVGISSIQKEISTTEQFLEERLRNEAFIDLSILVNTVRDEIQKFYALVPNKGEKHAGS